MIGRILSHYRLTREIGRGGMGEVYQADDIKLGRAVAVKILPSEYASSPDRRARFDREVRSIAALSHPNVLAIFDVGEENGISFAVTELLEGQTLREILDNGALSVERAVGYAHQIAAGLTAAHERGIVHRDLKPENLFVTTDDTVKILDFGLAAWRDSGSDASEEAESDTVSRHTQPGAVLGTMGYMSPEQVRGRSADHRSDLFGVGVVLYEMLVGRRPFAGPSAADTMSAILKERPPPIQTEVPGVPDALERIVYRCLEKSEPDRYQSSSDFVSALEALSGAHLSVSGVVPNSSAPAGGVERPRRRVPAVTLVLAVVVALAATYGWYRATAEQRWARSEGLPELVRLVEAGERLAAFELAKRVELALPGDPTLSELRPQFARRLSLDTQPSGAMVSVRPYGAPDSDWASRGVTPLEEIWLPRQPVQVKFEKEGFIPALRGYNYASGWFGTSDQWSTIALDEVGQTPAGMLRVPGGEAMLLLPGLESMDSLRMRDYWIDRYEVTNRAFKAFVDDGGYRKRTFWRYPFVKEGREIPFEAALSEFTDSAGRPGPSTWELGDYPDGRANYPVTGISWYEAAAYAAWAGKELPTVYHWTRAASTHLGDSILPGSNLGSRGLVEVGVSPAVTAYGASDMAGNAREWCLNEDGQSGRYVLGGGWNDQPYSFNDAFAQDPFDRSATNGLRCVRHVDALTGDELATLSAPIPRAIRDLSTSQPVSDEVFQVYLSLYRYDRTELNAEILETNDSHEDWTKESVIFDAAYGGERVPAYLFLPRDAEPPYQTIVYFPGSGPIYTRSSSNVRTSAFDFMIKSGRAVLFPVYEGTFERNRDGALHDDYAKPTDSYRDYAIKWAKDLGRSIDYLETRSDIDTDALAYYGTSWGGELGNLMLAVEPRFKAAVLYIAGLSAQPALPEADQLNFVTRVTTPVLMLNGRYDFFFPYETSQKPMFELLGTPPEHKRHVVYDTGHVVPRAQLLKESLDWLDKYLGPVERRTAE